MWNNCFCLGFCLDQESFSCISYQNLFLNHFLVWFSDEFLFEALYFDYTDICSMLSFYNYLDLFCTGICSMLVAISFHNASAIKRQNKLFGFVYCTGGCCMLVVIYFYNASAIKRKTIVWFCFVQAVAVYWLQYLFIMRPQ